MTFGSAQPSRLSSLQSKVRNWRTPPLSKEHLSIYLNDHLASADLALEIVDHLAAEAPDLASSLAALRREIGEDRSQLRLIMASLNIPESRVRKAGTWIAEQVAEAKLAVDDDPNGPLRRLERLEALSLGIEGKIALWRALDAVPAKGAFGQINYEQLCRRGEEQRSRVEGWRLQAAADTLVV